LHKGCSRYLVSAAAACLVLVMTGCAGKALPANGPISSPAACEGNAADGVTWVRIDTAVTRTNLDRWCASVGSPVVIEGPLPPTQARRLVIVSWNIHVGSARVADLATALRSEAAATNVHAVGFVLLLQEAFRAGDAVPTEVAGGIAGATAQRPNRPDGDVVDLARTQGLSLAYVPSMRNGVGETGEAPEDRGSAILSTERLSNVTAIELPFGRQRRIAVMATVDPAGEAPPLQVVSAHLDVIGGAGQQADHLASVLDSRLAGPPIVLGIDTNAIRGFRSRTVQVLGRSLRLVRECGTGRTNRWLARIDYIFSTVPQAHIRSCQTWPVRYDSDHAPIVLVLDY
jgi:endonuclease/exonuclease/phosphatase family metal-dependent hydrolase